MDTRRNLPRSGPRTILAVGLSAAVLVIAGTSAVAWHYSSTILGPDRPSSLHEQRVLSVEPGRVRLSRDAESLRPGTWALQWPDGYGWVGRVTTADSAGVAREFRSVVGMPTAGGWASLRGVSRSADPRTMLGRSFTTVEIDGPLGRYPAWFVPGPDSIWVIYVHGRAASRAEGLRALAVLAPRGNPGLFITYRNDAGAPRSRDGFYHLGLEEWRDLEAAVRWSSAHGARGVVIEGFSMGGQVALQFMAHSPLAREVRAIVLESPIVDWNATLDLRARVMGLPAFATYLAKRTATLRAGLDWGELDRTAHALGLGVPILVFSGVHDTYAPISASEAFVRSLPGIATLVRVPAGNHVEAWNVDSARYAATLNGWLTAHGVGRAPE